MVKELIATFPEYRHTWKVCENGLCSISLFSNAINSHHVALAIHVIGMGQEEHPFYVFFHCAFIPDFYDEAHEPYEFGEKIQILDAINTRYNFAELFKSDYELLKEDGFVNGQNTQESTLTTKNLIIFFQYIHMRGMSTNELFEEVEYDRLKEMIPELNEINN